MATQSGTDIPHLIDHLFRHQAGRMVAALTRIFGPQHLQLAEDVVQETLLKALKQWPYRGIPEKPEAWFMQVAKNRALDILRRETNLQQKIPLLLDSPGGTGRLELDDSLGDDQLTMLFMGCHPALSREIQAALLLKTLGGFSVEEIARAFLLPTTTVAQRIVRAKRKIRELDLAFELPDNAEIGARLDSALLVLYLIFSEGYNASQGGYLIRKDLCAEAIRLCALLIQHPKGDRPRVHALLALMLLQSSRFDARLTDGDDLLLLADQVRSKWDRPAIQAGIFHLERAAQGAEVSVYHPQAGIAACHALAPSYEETNWEQILDYYDQLLELAPSAVVQLNRAVALAEVAGARAGLESLATIDGLDDYYLFHATRAALYMRLGDSDAAHEHYRRALALANNEVEQRFLQQKLNATLDDLRT